MFIRCLPLTIGQSDHPGVRLKEKTIHSLRREAQSSLTGKMEVVSMGGVDLEAKMTGEEHSVGLRTRSVLHRLLERIPLDHCRSFQRANCHPAVLSSDPPGNGKKQRVSVSRVKRTYSDQITSSDRDFIGSHRGVIIQSSILNHIERRRLSVRFRRPWNGRSAVRWFTPDVRGHGRLRREFRCAFLRRW